MPRHATPREGEPVLFNGKQVPFSLWPKKLTSDGVIRTSSVWELLKYHVKTSKSHPFHGREAVLSYLDQSHDFFAAAVTATYTSKPLMLYYSYLNLAKAFVLYRRVIQSLPPNTLPFMHGLSYEPTGVGASLHSVTLRVQVSTSKMNMFDEIVSECRFPRYRSRTLLYLDELLYQIVSIHDTFISSESKPRTCFPAYLEFYCNKSQKTIWTKGLVYLNEFTPAERSSLRKFISEHNLLHEVTSSGDFLAFESNTASYTRSACEALRENLLEPLRATFCSIQDTQRHNYFINRNTDATAQLAADFAAMYTLSSIARYHPDALYQIENHWLIREYLSTQPMQFVCLMASGMVGNEVIPYALQPI